MNETIYYGLVEGQTWAQTQFYQLKRRTFINRLYRFTYKFTKEDRHEIVNDTFIKIFKYAPKHNQPGSFDYWCNLLLRQAALNYVEKYKSKSTKLNLTEPIESFEESSIDHLMYLEQIKTVLNSVKHRKNSRYSKYALEILQLHSQGYTYPEIAKKFNMITTTVKWLNNQSKKQLKNILK